VDKAVKSTSKKTLSATASLKKNLKDMFSASKDLQTFEWSGDSLYIKVNVEDYSFESLSLLYYCEVRRRFVERR